MKRFLEFMINYRKQVEAGIVTVLFLAASMGGIVFLNRLLSLPNDNAAEQKLEEILCEELDICLDLTPSDD